MNKEQQDLIWACLPKEARDEIKNDYNSHPSAYHPYFNEGYGEALKIYFGKHNLTSDTEPEEMLMAKANDVREFYENGQFLKGYKETKPTGELITSWMVKLFSDKCLPDKESEQSNLCDTCSNELKNSPDCSYFDSCGIKSCSDYKSKEQPRPRFKIGDKVIVSHINTYFTSKVVEVNKIYPQFTYKLENLPDVWFAESLLEPYTEPETKPLRVGDKVKVKGEDKVREVYRILPDGRIMFGDKGNTYSAENLELVEPETKENMEEKELNLLDILNDSHIGETFYSLIEGYVKFEGIEPHWKEYGMKPLRFAEGNFNPDGTYQTKPNASCCIWPSKELYEKYPLDPVKAWSIWASERKPKRWRAEEGKEYWYLSAFVIPEITSDDLLNGDDKLYECGNYFRTKIEARQAAEAVRETLMKFHELNQKQ